MATLTDASHSPPDAGPDGALAHWWFGRFRVCGNEHGELHFRDMLMPQGRTLPASRFAKLRGREREQAWFQAGFVPGALGAALDEIAEQPRHQDDPMFWQYPCRTEGAAWDLHASRPEALRLGDALHLYLGLPWATWIDKANKNAWGATGLSAADAQWRRTAVRLSGLRAALQSVGLQLRVHTVCQHIRWTDLLERWQSLGVTDLWLSHCPAADVEAPPGMTLHPWRLFAVNVEDANRRAGLETGRDPERRSVLASFVGAHAAHYLSDIRPRLRAFADEPDVSIELTDQWHFEAVVYDGQVQGRATAAATPDPSVRRYNEMLSDSVFSLCPAGAGANTLRLWESLASGAIPVLFEPWPRLPEAGTLPAVDWTAAVVHVRDEELQGLLPRLRAMPLAERRHRQQKGMALFEQVRHQRCF